MDLSCQVQRDNDGIFSNSLSLGLCRNPVLWFAYLLVGRPRQSHVRERVRVSGLRFEQELFDPLDCVSL